MKKTLEEKDQVLKVSDGVNPQIFFLNESSWASR